MILDATKFRWPVAAAYTIVEVKPRKRATIAEGEGGPEVVGTGKIRYKLPLAMHPGRTLASVLRNGCEAHGLKEGVEQFAQTYGLLHGGQCESLLSWEELLRIIRSADRGFRLKPGRMPVDVVVTNTKHGPTFSLVPKNLFAAIQLELAQAIVSGSTVVTCMECGNHFELGGDKGKRADAIYCSKGCRYKFNNRQRDSA